MQRSFLSGLFLILLLNLLVKPFFILGIDAEVQNRVGEAVYGNYFSLLNFSLLLNILLDLGITNYNTRNIAQHPHLISKNFSKILWLRFSLFILYAVFTLVSGIFVGYSGDEVYLLSILMINQFLIAIIQFCRSNFGGLHLFRSDAVVSVMDRLLLIVFCAVMLWTNLLGSEFNIAWFVYAQTLAYLLTALFALIMLRKEAGAIKLNFKRNFSVVLLKNSFPYALLIFLMMLYNRLDSVMLERLLPDGDVQAGIYAQGFRYLDAVNMFALLFAGMLLPVFARQLKINGDVMLYVNLAVRLLLGMSIVAGMTAFFFQKELLELRYPEVSDVSARSFGYLILSFIPVSMTYIYGTLLTASGKLKQLNAMAFNGLILNVLLNLLLIPAYKAEGAAMATLITQGVTAVIQVVLAYRLVNIRFNVRLFAGLFLLGVILTASFYFTQVQKIDSMKALLLVFMAGLAAAFMLRLLRFSDLKEMLRQK
ncbi:MAG: oligosaccharide flippase family protein [Bacteroidetes bacterium]|nr:oligosaccharide flippase family protein [Bacteroidota bacterium]